MPPFSLLCSLLCLFKGNSYLRDETVLKLVFLRGFIYLKTCLDPSSYREKMEDGGILTYNGRYVMHNVLGNIFDLSSKYIPPIQPIGRGAYGIVW